MERDSLDPVADSSTHSASSTMEEEAGQLVSLLKTVVADVIQFLLMINMPSKKKYDSSYRNFFKHCRQRDLSEHFGIW